jgi:hypothetical protein
MGTSDQPFPAKTIEGKLSDAIAELIWFWIHREPEPEPLESQTDDGE